ncbi:hypothetical protein CI102_841 [Trichoderma harzianum]|nr:hypothetical protein CI102_841 [Trichoderma harzianum]
MCKRLIFKFMLRGANLTAPQCSMNNPLIAVLLLLFLLLKVLSSSLSDLLQNPPQQAQIPLHEWGKTRH